MKTYKKILATIEAVNSSTASADLDELDARVWCYINKYEFLYVGMKGLKNGYGFVNTSNNEDFVTRGKIKQYTRSRDVLKKIRPKEWHVIRIGKYLNPTSYYCELQSDDRYDQRQVNSYYMFSEELAELYAIVKAIAWDRRELE